jgi:TatD DNase family protein
VGETGLDFFRTPEPEGQRLQEASFRAHIAIAKATGTTLVIHDRDAHDDVVRVLLDEGAPERVVFHCFSGRPGPRPDLREHGWWASFAGPVTFKANDDLRAAVRGHPGRAAPGRDRRAVPHADAVPRPAERALPRAADGTGDGAGQGLDVDALCAAIADNGRRAFSL